jgi:hypothetical protein
MCWDQIDRERSKLLNRTVEDMIDFMIRLIQTMALLMIGYRIGTTSTDLSMIAIDGTTVVLAAIAILPYQIWGWIENWQDNRKKQIECSE